MITGVSNEQVVAAVLDSSRRRLREELPDLSETDLMKLVKKAIMPSKKKNTVMVVALKTLILDTPSCKGMTSKQWQKVAMAAWTEANPTAPIKTKRPFDVFKSDRMKSIKAETPDISFTDMMKQIAEEWKEKKTNETSTPVPTLTLTPTPSSSGTTDTKKMTPSKRPLENGDETTSARQRMTRSKQPKV